jgi:hypothetical protein
MIGERTDISSETNYGDLVMRPYLIENNHINAFYDENDVLVFVVDNTITEKKPNVLLVINPDGDKKWDEILSGQYNVDLETIRPKQDNKYQKLDIEYSGLNVYENLINAYVAGDDISEHIVQLNILRDSAARHSAMTRLNVANEIITKTNATIVRTKETVIRLQERLKSLRAKLSQQKKEIGKVPTKQSASKILRIESQIDATNEKIKRAKKRLESAQKRLEIATVDAELASDLLNQPETQIVHQTPAPKSKAVSVAPKHEVASEPEDFDDDEEYDEEIDEVEEEKSEIKPLFDKDPEIMNEEIAFKPINFDTPVFTSEYSSEIQDKPVKSEQSVSEFQEVPVPEPSVEEYTNMMKVEEPEESEDVDFVPPVFNEEPAPLEIKPVENVLPDTLEEKPVLETFTPIEPVADITNTPVEEPDVAVQEPVVEEPAPVENVIRPMPPVPQIDNAPKTEPQNLQNYMDVVKQERSKPAFIYYILLLILIVLSVFTLWAYQKNMQTTTPSLVAPTVEQQTEPEKPVSNEPKDVVVDADEVFLDVAEPVAEEKEPVPEEPVVEQQPVVEETTAEEPVVEEPAPVEDDVFVEETPVEEETEPVVLDAVPAKVMTSGMVTEEEVDEESIAEPVVDKPVYEVSSKHDDIFVSEPQPEETDVAPESEDENALVSDEESVPVNPDDLSYDEEEAQYQAEMEYEE